MIDEENGTCICGHELTADNACIVWDKHGNEHVFPNQGAVCSCHGLNIRTVEKREWYNSS